MRENTTKKANEKTAEETKNGQANQAKKSEKKKGGRYKIIGKIIFAAIACIAMFVGITPALICLAITLLAMALICKGKGKIFYVAGAAAIFCVCVPGLMKALGFLGLAVLAYRFPAVSVENTTK